MILEWGAHCNSGVATILWQAVGCDALLLRYASASLLMRAEVPQLLWYRAIVSIAICS